MPEPLADLLMSHDADDALIQHAVRYLVAELSEDMSTEQMLSCLREAATDPTAIDAVQRLVERDGTALLEVDLAVLDAFWCDHGSREMVKRTVRDAKQKLPVVEVGIVAVSAMYGMYLVATGGKKSTTRTTRLPDGTLRSETVEYHNPGESLGAVARLLGAFSSTAPPIGESRDGRQAPSESKRSGGSREAPG